MSHEPSGVADASPHLVACPRVGMSERIAREEGFLVGISAGANILAAKRVAARLGPGHTIVTILLDRGERYLSLKLDT